jgi:uncharacterized protein (UPF0276 family)
LERSGAGLLLDLDALYENALTHDKDPEELLREFPLERVWQFHLGGRRNECGAVFTEVWNLYRVALSLLGPRPTIVEWSSPVPPLERALADVTRARSIQRAAASECERCGGSLGHELAS